MAAKLLPKIVFPNKPENEMLIGGYVEPLVYGKYVKEYDVKIGFDEAYDDFKNANFNTLLETESTLNRGMDDVVTEIFRQTDRLKLNFLFRDSNVCGLQNRLSDKTAAELKEYFEKAYAPLEKYSSFAGLHVVDEPGYKDWKNIRTMREGFRAAYPDKLYFVNLLQVYAPAWAFPNGPFYLPGEKWWLKDDNDYIKYYESYLKEADPEVFCYDYYPMRYEFPFILDQYFLQLHLAYKYSKENDLPLISFVQNGNWDTATRIPNEDEIRWQINTALAYNTKGLVYYTYWAVNPYHKRMCVHESGEKTPNYYIVKKINKELLFLGEYILNAAFEGYMLFGKTPNGEAPVEEDRIYGFDGFRNFSGGDVFAGCFTYYKDGRQLPMMIAVNNNVKDRLENTLYLEKETYYTLLHGEERTDGYGDEISLKFTPGDAYFIILNK